MVPSLTVNCNSTFSNLTVRFAPVCLGNRGLDFSLEQLHLMRCMRLARRKERRPANNSKRGVKPMDQSQQQQQQFACLS